MKKFFILSMLYTINTMYAASESGGMMSRFWSYWQKDPARAEAARDISASEYKTPCVDAFAPLCTLPEYAAYGPTRSIACAGKRVARALYPQLVDGYYKGNGAIQEYDCSGPSPVLLSSTEFPSPQQVAYTSEEILCWISLLEDSLIQVRRANGSDVDVSFAPNTLESSTIDNEANWLVTNEAVENDTMWSIQLYNLDAPIKGQELLRSSEPNGFNVSILSGSPGPSVAMVSLASALIWKNGQLLTQIVPNDLPKVFPGVVSDNVAYAYNSAVFSPDGVYCYLIANNVVVRCNLQDGTISVCNYTLNQTADSTNFPTPSRLSMIDSSGEFLAISDPAGMLVMDTKTMQMTGSYMKLNGSGPSVAPGGAVALNFGTDLFWVASRPKPSCADCTVDTFNQMMIQPLPYPRGGGLETE